MERLSDIMMRLRSQSERRVLPTSRWSEHPPRLPVGTSLGEDDEEEHGVLELGTVVREALQEPPATRHTRFRTRRRDRIRVVDSMPPDKPGTRPLAEVPLPRVMLPPPVTAQSVCPHCKGAGYLRADVPFGHPLFGKPLPCECKRARVNEERRLRLRAQSQIDWLAAFREASFETFHYLLPGVQEAYEEALRFARQPQGWLVLEGNNGCGKTHLAVSLAKYCLDEGTIVLFSVVADLLDYLRATFAPNAEEPYDEAFTKMREAELLVLDDLGAEQSTPWANEKLYQLLNYRYNARLPTVITTNKISLVGIENRIRSRLSDKRLVRIVTMTEAQDYRLLEE